MATSTGEKNAGTALATILVLNSLSTKLTMYNYMFVSRDKNVSLGFG